MNELNEQWCKYDEYIEENKISFRYILSKDEKKNISDIIYNVLNKFTSPIQTIPYIKNGLKFSNLNLDQIYFSLDNFFKKFPGNYFLRISSCSPKDAWYQLYSETPKNNLNNEENEIITIEEIIRDINILKVSSAEQCILVLCHSLRIYYDLESDSIGENAILLLPWKNNILNDTETRCFIKNKKLIAFSQYYVDLEIGYQSIQKLNIFPNEFYKSAINFVNYLILNEEIPYNNCVVDISLSKEVLNESFKNLEINNFIFIEINPFNSNTDNSFFEWDYFFNFDTEKLNYNPEFRYNNYVTKSLKFDQFFHGEN